MPENNFTARLLAYDQLIAIESEKLRLLRDDIQRLRLERSVVAAELERTTRYRPLSTLIGEGVVEAPGGPHR